MQAYDTYVPKYKANAQTTNRALRTARRSVDIPYLLSTVVSLIMVWPEASAWSPLVPATYLRVLRCFGGFPLEFDVRRPSKVASGPPRMLLLPTAALLVQLCRNSFNID